MTMPHENKEGQMGESKDAPQGESKDAPLAAEDNRVEQETGARPADKE